MPSADFCTVIPAPHGAGSPDGQPCRSPRVLRTHFHAYACRIYVMAFCASIGLRRFRTAYPAMPPRIRFLFVRPAICLGLPSDSQSPAKPLPLASTSPCRVCGGLSPLSECALPGAPIKNRPEAVYRYDLSVAKLLRRKQLYALLRHSGSPAYTLARLTAIPRLYKSGIARPRQFG